MPFSHLKPVDVKRVGTTLVAAFHNAHPPLIWKFDLERNHSFTIALQGEDQDWELGITSPKGEFFPIAHFPNREDADSAFASVQKVLMKPKRSLISQALIVVGVGLLAVIVILACLSVKHVQHMPSMPSVSSLPTVAPFTGGPQYTPSTAPTGVPVPADEVLQPPH